MNAIAKSGPTAGRTGPAPAGSPAVRAEGGTAPVVPAQARSAPAKPAKGRSEPGPAAIVIELPSSEGSRRARRRRIRSALLRWLFFLAMVAAPTGLTGWYLYARAADQYLSEVSFAVRSLDPAAPSPVLDIFGAGADGTSGESQMLFEYLSSQPLVEAIDAKLDLRAIYNREGADPVFRMGEAGSIEDVIFYWSLAVTPAYDNLSGIINVQALAFDPDDAQRIAAAVREESERLINDLSTKARQDAVTFALEDLGEAEARIREIRRELQNFRQEEGSADVRQDIVAAMSLISGLKSQRAALKAEYDSRARLIGADSPALGGLLGRISSLDAQIAEEERRIAANGDAGPAGSSLTDAAGAQEELMVELKFAEAMYTSALGAVETARAEARRAQRYLATHIAPTRAEAAEHPQKAVITGAVFATTLITWSIILLVVSSIRDRS